MIPRSIKNFLFDLDGTLIDSSEIIISCLKDSLLEAASLDVSRHSLSRLCGLSLPEVMNQLGVDNADVVIECFSRQYPGGKRAELFDGIEDLLEDLSKARYHMAVVTTKKKKDALMHLEETGIAEYFEAIVTSNDVRKLKPDPEPVLRAMNMLDSEPEESVMVGDSPVDIRAGRAAGAFTGLALWDRGDAHGDRQTDYFGADFTWSHPSEIMASLS